MLTAAQVIPFLTHQDPWVRAHALHYLTEAHDPSPATADDLWHAIDAIDADQRRRFYSDLSSLPETDHSTRRLIDSLRERRDPEVRGHLLSALKRLEFPLLQAHAQEIRRLPALPAETVRHIDSRLELSTQPPHQLWDALKSYSDEMGEAYLDEIDPDVPARLIDALSRHPDFTAPRALEIISQPPDVTWLQVWAVDLTGRLRLQAAVDPLVHHLEIDEYADYFLARVIDALRRLASPELVGKIGGVFQRGDWADKISATELLRDIKLPQSESLIPELITAELRGDGDNTILGFLGTALAHLCPTEPSKLEIIRSLVNKGRFESTAVDLLRDLVSAATMADWRPPEMNVWRQQVAKEEERIRKLLDDPDTTNQLARSITPARREQTKPATPPDEPPVAPFRREAPKVGRNDPCPCGSGKKYKKCCGRE